MSATAAPLALLAVLGQVARGPAGALLSPDEPVHLTVELRAPDLEGMLAFNRALQNPRSPQFRQFLSPDQFGARFGASPALYGSLAAWLETGGFQVERFPNRLVVSATGTAGAVMQLLHLPLRHVPGRPAGVHVPALPGRLLDLVQPALPSALRGWVLAISGLDTSPLHHRRLLDSYGNLGYGPQDLRTTYDSWPLLDAGFSGQGATLVILGSAELPAETPDPGDFTYFYRNVSNNLAQVSLRRLPNPAMDFGSAGDKLELELDLDMQAVGPPEAHSVILVMPPASEQFIAGPNDIVNNLWGAVSVSTSFGLCEPQELTGSPDEPAAMRQLVLQGVIEGQTWSAASGDNGSDDCGDGSQVAVDFPASLPEMLAVGGTQPENPVFDSHGALPRYEAEEVWNDQMGGAAGGGFSVIFGAPGYQVGSLPASFWPAGSAAGRVVPDIALVASPSPGVEVDDTAPAVVDASGGTSASSPLSAGLLALLSDRLGCRLGDVHAALYSLGLAQFDGGRAVFHDVTVGSVAADGLPGAGAGIGFDPASGWGSVDLAALAAVFPPCPRLDGGGVVFDAGGGGYDAGGDEADLGSGPPFDPCALLLCDGGQFCDQLPEGPAFCTSACRTDGGPGCPEGQACGASEVCLPGNPDGGVGLPCAFPTDCAPGEGCLDQATTGFLEGYCYGICDGGGQCPAGSLCDLNLGGLCVTACAGTCQRAGYVCQPVAARESACLVKCLTAADCQNLGLEGATCDVASGICALPADGGLSDAGPLCDAGLSACRADAGPPLGPDAGADAGPPTPDGGTSTAKGGGCGCESAGRSDSGTELGLWVAALGGLLPTLRRRRCRPMTAPVGRG